MNWKTWVPLVLAVFLGLVAAKAGRDLVVRAQRAGMATGKFTEIVAAKNDLTPGQALTDSDLILVAVESENVPRNAFRQPAELSGRILMTAVVRGQAILETLLAPTGSGAGPQALVPAGMRAIAVNVDESSGLAGLLTPGCCVDVVSTLQDESLGQQVARTIVERARVLAVGQRLMAATRKDGEESARAKTVTLLVSPREAEAIELACNAGRTRLVLRGSLDSSKGNPNGVTFAELLGDGRPKPAPVDSIVPANTPPIAMPEAPVNAPVVMPSHRSVEVIRNGVATLVEVPASARQEPNALTSGGMDVAPMFPGRSP